MNGHNMKLKYINSGNFMGHAARQVPLPELSALDLMQHVSQFPLKNRRDRNRRAGGGLPDLQVGGHISVARPGEVQVQKLQGPLSA